MNRTVEQRESLKIERLRLATSICCSVIINEDLRIAMFRDSKNKNFNPDKLTPDDYIIKDSFAIVDKLIDYNDNNPRQD